MSSENYITNDFENLININVIGSTFPLLLQEHKNILSKYLYGSVQMIASSNAFYNDSDNFNKKMQQNNYKDLKWLLSFLLPYMNKDKKNTNELTDLNELYTLRSDTVPEDIKQKALLYNVEDINLSSPKYIFSNLQYGRCLKNNNSYQSIHFKEEHLKDNYYLLLDAIRVTRYKMYINWIDILPFQLDTYKSNNLYKDTKYKIFYKMSPKWLQ